MLKFKCQINDDEIPPIIVLEINKELDLDIYLKTYRDLINKNNLESVNIKLDNNCFNILTNNLSNYKIDFIELKILRNSIYLMVSHKYTNELFEYYLCTEGNNEL